MKGVSEALFPACKPSPAREPFLPWGLCQLQSTCHLQDYISETHFEKDRLGPGGLYLCVLVLGRQRKEKRRRRRRSSGRDGPGFGKQLVENGKLLLLYEFGFGS